MADYILPDFLQNQSTDEIHQRMLDNLPDDLDKTEGGFAWDFTRPTAIEKAEMIGYSLQETIKIMFPQWSYGQWLDLHAQERGLSRKEAVSATGTVTVTGTAGTKISSGALFQTEATADAASLQFESSSDAEISNSGTVNIQISAVVAGATGNVAVGSITLLAQPIKGVVSVTNTTVTAGGTDAETDDDLRQRILNYDATQGLSYVGSATDYKRWAMEVDGVGSTEVITPTDGSGLITLIIRDSTGAPASDTLLNAVVDHIMCPNDPQNRLAPINALLSVIAPTLVNITISAKVVIDSSTTKDDVTKTFMKNLTVYYQTAISEGVVKYNAIGALLMSIAGVSDYSNLTLNGGTANITIATDQTPSTAGVTLSV